MKLKLKTLSVTLLLSLTASSQIVTKNNEDCTIKLSCNTAQQVAVDLVACDSVKNELATSEQKCNLLEQRINEYANINNAYEVSLEEYGLLEKAYEKQEKKLIGQIGDLNKQIIKQQKTIKVFRTGFVISTTAVATAALFLYLK